MRQYLIFKKSPAFTLLEVLISMSLLIVLVSIIWSLIRIYSNYYTAGTRRIDRTQLVRSLSQLLNDDLSAAIQDPIHPLPPLLAAEDVVRRFGLLGTSDSLRIDVLQINPLAAGTDLYFTRQAAVGPVQDVKMQVPELKTIYYDFLPLAAQSFGKQSGLVRRELSFETLSPPGDSLQGVPSTSNTFADIGVNPLMPGPENQNLLPKSPTIAEQLLHENDPNAMWAPEIVEIRFRYGDGANWADSWNSIEKNGLPVAVEVQMKLMPVGDVEKLRQKSSLLPQTVSSSEQAPSSPDNEPVRAVGSRLPSATPGVPDAVPQTRTLESLAEELGFPPPAEQRLVVYLATSPLIKSDPVRRPAPPASPGPSAPAASPGLRPAALPGPAPPQPTVPSQQWLRK